ncbi:unnamed protein product, partial [Chrysoparadoxa australica]
MAHMDQQVFGLAKLVPKMSVQEALAHPKVTVTLQAFCKANYLEENYDFAKAVEAFKLVPCGPAKKVVADLVCREYLTQSEKKNEINVSAKQRQAAVAAAKKANNDCFDSVLKEVIKILKSLWSRFLESDEYAELIRANQDEAGSGGGGKLSPLRRMSLKILSPRSKEEEEEEE